MNLILKIFLPKWLVIRFYPINKQLPISLFRISNLSLLVSSGIFSEAIF